MKTYLILSVGVVATAAAAMAQTESPVQSAARPFGLDIAVPVMLAASDAQSAQFQSETLPELMKVVTSNLGESRKLSDFASKSLDPSQLVMSTDAQVRVYFLGEGAGYKNTLGYNTSGTGIAEGSPSIIYPDASSRVSWYNSTGVGPRSAGEPLFAGDFVNLGTVSAGERLDFFLIANGAAQNPSASSVWTAFSNYNSDGLQHMASFAVAGSPYLLLSFEDLRGGGDLDFNDLVFAVEIGVKNVEALANPEPHEILTFALVGIAVWFARRRFASPCPA